MRWLRAAAVLLTVAGCAPPESASQRYERWLEAGSRAQVRAYESYLQSRDVAGIVPTAQLLRTGRRWRSCRVAEFSVPPRDSWPEIVATLVLVDELKKAGVLRAPQVASAWRDKAFNACEGGSTRSRHLRNNALDFDVVLTERDVERLCRYWRRHGDTLRFGLGFYSSTRIHVDTTGFRTWGYDYRRATSQCVRIEGARARGAQADR